MFIIQNMRKIALSLLMLLSTVAFAQMSDQQVIQFLQAEYKAGTSQAQIVTKLVQKGVTMDQIRRLQKQYGKQINQSGQSGRVNAAVSDINSRLRTKTDTEKSTVGRQDQAVQLPTSSLQQEGMTEQQDNTPSVDEPSLSNSMKVFGRDIFNKKLLSFEPNMNIATPQNYVLGPGDQVIVDIYGASQKSQQLEVSPDGVIVVDGYGPIQVGGLSVSAAQKKLRSTLGSRYKSSNLQMSVGQTRSLMVNVMGEVKAPGTYTLSAFSTVFHALYMAGGINDLGTLRNIKVYRNGKHISTVDVYQYILNGRLSGNIRLQENDMIIVGPYEALVNISGHIKRPMFYEMRPTESVAQVVKYAGGFSSDAYKKAVRLVRKSGERYSVHTVEEFDMSSFKVADGDSIGVDAMVERYENMVEVKGGVFRPGLYELGKQITSVRALVEAAGGLTEDAFTGRAVMYRMKKDRTLETQSIDLSGIMSGSVPDVPLRNEDVLFIPTISDHQNLRTLTITGEVIFPGTYEYADNMTLEDFILQAGGLTDKASTAKVDVSRRFRNPDATEAGMEIAKTYSFSLKDNYVVDDGKNFLLEPYDIVQVRQSPVFQEPIRVYVGGEVAFRGT